MTDKRKIGAYLDETLLSELDNIGAELGLSRNKVISMACRRLIQQIENGEFIYAEYIQYILEKYKKLD